MSHKGRTAVGLEPGSLTVAAAWLRSWDRVIPFFAFPPEVRRVVYTTNAIESVHGRLRKIIKTRGHFPSDDAASKLIWLALSNIVELPNRPGLDAMSSKASDAIVINNKLTTDHWRKPYVQ